MVLLLLKRGFHYNDILDMDEMEFEAYVYNALGKDAPAGEVNTSEASHYKIEIDDEDG